MKIQRQREAFAYRFAAPRTIPVEKSDYKWDGPADDGRLFRGMMVSVNGLEDVKKLQKNPERAFELGLIRPELGNHWSPQSSYARSYAQSRMGGGIGIVLHGIPQKDTQLWDDRAGVVYERRTKSGDPVNVVGLEIHWPGSFQHPEYHVYRDLSPRQMVASRHFALELSDEEAAAFEKYVSENGGKIPATLGKPEKVKPIPPEVLDQMMEDPYFFEDSGPDDWYGGQGRKWYHVSPNEMDEGTVLVPGGIDGKATSQDFYDMGFGDDTGTLADMGGGRNTHVWLTPDLDDAHFWAAALNAPNIYEVTPDDDPEPWNGTGVDGWVSRGGKIHRRVAFLPKSDDDPALYTREIPSINPAEALRDHPVVKGFQEYLDAGLAPEDPLHAMEQYLGYYHPQDRIYYDLLQRYIGEPVTDSYPFPPTKGAPALPKEPYAEVTYPPGYELEYDDPRPGAYYARRQIIMAVRIDRHAMADTTPWHPLIKHDVDLDKDIGIYQIKDDRNNVIGVMEYSLSDGRPSIIYEGQGPWHGTGCGCEPGTHASKCPTPASSIELAAVPAAAGIDKLFVHPDHRGQGIAQAFIERLHQDYPDHKIDPGVTTVKGYGFTEHLRKILPEANDALVPGYTPDVLSPQESSNYDRSNRERYEKAAYSDQTRFQQDFAEDQQSGEPLDEQQKRFIEYFRRFDDMASNARGEYTPRGGWPQ